jgi:hypothetical protein
MAVIRGNLLTTQLLVAHGADTKILSKVFDKQSAFISKSSVFRLVGKHFNN